MFNTLKLVAEFTWIAAGVWAFFTWYHEHKATRVQTATDLRWRKSEAAKALVDEFVNDKDVNAVCNMLDWKDYVHELPSGVKVTITDAALCESLSSTSSPPTELKMYVQSSFDSLFYYMAVFQHWVSLGLVEFADVRFPLEYYVRLLTPHRTAIDNYLNDHRLERADRFLKNFEEWRGSR